MDIYNLFYLSADINFMMKNEVCWQANYSNVSLLICTWNICTFFLELESRILDVECIVLALLLDLIHNGNQYIVIVKML